jgi:hypothetical protein
LGKLAAIRTLQRGTFTGRPVGNAEFVARLEQGLGRPLAPRQGPTHSVRIWPRCLAINHFVPCLSVPEVRPEVRGSPEVPPRKSPARQSPAGSPPPGSPPPEVPRSPPKSQRLPLKAPAGCR